MDSTDWQENSALHFACFHGHNDVVTFLIDQGSSVETQGSHGLTPLDMAKVNDHKDVVCTLVAKNAPAGTPEEGEDLAFHRASAEGNNEAVKTLVENQSASLNTVGKYGRTALVCASLYGHIEVVETLLGNGASVDAQDKHGRTVLHYASLKGHNDVVITLLDNGASALHRNEFGRTAIDWAIRSGHSHVVETLREHLLGKDGEKSDVFMGLIDHKQVVKLPH